MFVGDNTNKGLRVLDHIETNPFLYPIKKIQFREAPTKVFPYIIVYKINQKQKRVNVFSVFHTKRNSKGNLFRYSKVQLWVLKIMNIIHFSSCNVVFYSFFVIIGMSEFFNRTYFSFNQLLHRT